MKKVELQKEDSKSSVPELIKEEEQPKENTEEISSPRLSAISHKQEEEPSKIEEPRTEEKRDVEVQGTLPETKERGCGGRWFKHHRFGRIVKKLAKKNLAPEERERLEGVLRSIQEGMTEEQKQEFQLKRERILQRQAEKAAERKAEMRELVTDMIYEQLPTIASLARDLAQDIPVAQPKPSSQEQANPVVHHRVQCDGCDTSPIVGVRYKCSVCPDFDFCENCEASKEHAHPFIKLRKADENPMRGHGPFRGPWGPHRGGWGRWGNREGCPFSRRQGCEDPEKMKNFCSKWKEFKNSQGFGGLLGSLMTGTPLNTEQTEDVSKLYSEVPKECQEKLSNHYKNLPEELRSQVNAFLGNLPEKLLEKKEEEKPEQKNEEVKIEEIVIEKEVVPEEKNVPLIQEVIPEKKEEASKKQYAQNVVEKAEKLREIFIDASVEDLCEFVSKVPQLSLEELVENYLASL